MGRAQKYCFQSLPRAGLVGPRSRVGNLPSKQAAVQDVGTAIMPSGYYSFGSEGEWL